MVQGSACAAPGLGPNAKECLDQKLGLMCDSMMKHSGYGTAGDLLALVPARYAKKGDRIVCPVEHEDCHSLVSGSSMVFRRGCDKKHNSTIKRR